MSIDNKDRCEEVEYILKQTLESRKPGQIVVQRRGIDEMEIDEKDSNPQVKRQKTGPPEEANALSLKHTHAKVSKEIGDIENLGDLL